MRRLSPALLFFAFASGLAACAPRPAVISRESQPFAKVTAVRAARFDGHRADLEVQLEIDNPGPPLRLLGADYELLAEDKGFAEGVSSLSGQLEKGVSHVTVPLYAAYLDLPDAAQARVNEGRPVHLIVRGVLETFLFIPAKTIEFAGEVDLPVADTDER